MDSFFVKIILNEFCKIIGTHWLIFVQQSGTYQVKLAAFIFGAEQAKHPGVFPSRSCTLEYAVLPDPLHSQDT